MSDKFTQQQYEIMEKYLDDNGYGTYKAWAEDSDYVELREPVATSEGWLHTSEWLDEHGNPVDIEVQLWFAIEAAQEVAEESKIGV
jgi:hypothetical protein